MPRYSLAICNYNMAETLERSLRSMIDQTGEAYEIVVVDDGSTDGSREILRTFADECSRLRVVELPRDPDRKLGETRNISFRETTGDYLIESLDVDDYYYPGVIPDFVELFHQFERQIDRPFLLHGRGINVSPRWLLVEEYPYLNLPRRTDRDKWRRLFADERIIWLDHGPVAESIGYDRGPVAAVLNDIEEKACDFQAGISFWSTIAWTLSRDHPYILEDRRGPLATVVKRAYDLLSFPLAYAIALGRPRHEAPRGFANYGALERTIQRKGGTLSELEERYELSVDRNRISMAGRERFCR